MEREQIHQQIEIRWICQKDIKQKRIKNFLLFIAIEKVYFLDND